jgi:hypothetical protein
MGLKEPWKVWCMCQVKPVQKMPLLPPSLTYPPTALGYLGRVSTTCYEKSRGWGEFDGPLVLRSYHIVSPSWTQLGGLFNIMMILLNDTIVVQRFSYGIIQQLEMRIMLENSHTPNHPLYWCYCDVVTSARMMDQKSGPPAGTMSPKRAWFNT